MRKNSDYFIFLAIGFSLAILVYFSQFFIPLKLSSSINDFSYWYTYFFSRSTSAPLKLVTVAVDDYSLNRLPQRWPPKRSVFARLLRNLDQQKAHTVAFDFALEGASENPADDQELRQALEEASCQVVLGYRFDEKSAAPVLPLSLRPQDAYLARYSLGMFNTPVDHDGMRRRLRGFVETEGVRYYSFALTAASVYLEQSPQEVAASMPLLSDRTFFINFLLRPADVQRLHFSDCLDSMDVLEQRFGKDFLKGALVLVYPQAEIFHDRHPTPLGEMSGGLLHLNGSAQIIARRFIRLAGFTFRQHHIDVLVIPFLIAAVLVLSLLVVSTGFISGFLLMLGVVFLGFWVSVLFGLNGLKFDLASLVIFSFLFYAVASLYKYTYFVTQLLKIKNKATLDPLRNIYTLRYFYYRLELELKKIMLGKDLFLIFVYLESFRAETDDFSVARLTQLWQRIHPVISVPGSFWSEYAGEELCAGLISTGRRIETTAQSIRVNLEALLKEWQLRVPVRLACVRLKREYPVRELLLVLSQRLRQENASRVFVDDAQVQQLLHEPSANPQEGSQLLDRLDADIEEKNRQLLTLLEALKKEHVRTQESFFQIIGSLVNALEQRDPYTQGHSERVTRYALMMADRLGWNKEEKEKLRRASLLHDLGKIGIPDSILHKSGRLTDEEFDFIKKHEIIAVKILEPLKEIEDILPWILYHHERWDGKGYPHGLGGSAIPMASQIISLADVYDALTTGRDYKKAFTPEESLAEIEKCKGAQFDPALADGFIAMIRQMQGQK